jgi:S-adenosyl-L-methionine hydrolase (adenosine-forming)
MDGHVPRPIVTFLSDFGFQDTFVGQMKAVVVSACPDAIMIDLTHQVPPQDVLAGAIHLRAAWHWFPNSTVHVAVVDPGVGTSRRAIGIEFQRHIFLGPDNGLFGGVLGSDLPNRTVELDHPVAASGEISRTFHGRDVFAAAAGQLAAGTDLSDLGSEFDPEELLKVRVPEPVIAGDFIVGEVLVVDRYGNAVTNIPATALRVESLGWSAKCGTFTVERLSSTYAEVDEGAPLAAVSSIDTVELGVRNGSAAERYHLRSGMPVYMQRSAQK